MAVEPDSAGVRFPPPFIYLGALLLGLAAERFVTLRSHGHAPSRMTVDRWRSASCRLT